MSADNGIYILETKNSLNPDGKEYRVSHLQAVENVYYDEDLNQESDKVDVHLKNARVMWIGRVYHSRADALVEADRQLQEVLNNEYCPVCEYGISFIVIDGQF